MMINFIKSLFISLFPVFGLYVFIDCILNLLSDSFLLGNFGRMLCALGIIVFFAALFLKPVARTERIPVSYTLFIVLTFLFSMVSDVTERNVTISHSLVSLLLLTGWFVYLWWYSSFDEREQAEISVGRSLPEFFLEDTHKNEVPSSSFKGKPSIYIFYRGNWCPLCMAQISEVAQQYRELEKHGAQVVLISPQPHKYSASLARKYDLGFHFMVDRNNKAAELLNIHSVNGIPAGFQLLGYQSNTVMPTVIITDKQGKVIFADLTDNYRVRPEPETFLRVLHTLNNKNAR
ncbi:redoxin domain-containing protein [Leptobacterium flavescens]|uniref:thioredoxin-dependent peroxiredoxin n=1 Tax=Leptobacterium flavescens TaxID=472055 RepID=A0A6P0UGG1_9FLAO|nr:peroxiredoxin family protein [Leptobacterium flavescens]NER12325.1 redoxin domain-containing protein [Leptobacterium flavescens]